jgi:O-antigen/teichoic acid export membrane protein
LVFGAFGSVLQGAQRLDLWNLTLLIDTLVTGAGSVAVVRSGFGLPGLVAVRLVSTSIAGLLSVAFAFRAIPGLRAHPKLISASIRREVLGYSANIFVARIAVLTGEPLVRIFIARLAALASVTPFDIAARAVGQMRGVFSAMLVPLLPASSSLHAAGHHELISRLYERSTRVAAISALPVFSGVAAFAQPLVLLWLGPGNAVAATTILCLAVVATAALLSTPAYTILEGTGHARWNAATSTAASITGILLSVSLGHWYGYWGVVLGYAIGSILGFSATLLAFHRSLGVPFRCLTRSVPPRLPLVCILVSSLAQAAQRRYGIDNVVRLAVAIALFYGVLTVALLLSRSTSIDEARSMLRLLRGSVSREPARTTTR